MLARNLAILALAFGLLHVAASPGARAQVATYDDGSIYELDPPSRQATGSGLLEALVASRQVGNMRKLGDYGEGDVFRRLGQPVARLGMALETAGGETKRAYCTASLIADDLVLTNHHCIAGNPGGRVFDAVLTFGYLQRGTERGVKRYGVELEPVEASADLDYAIHRVRGAPGRQWGRITLSLAEPRVRQSLFIIHHPAGDTQHISLGNCQTSDPALEGERLLHVCDTIGGSSGAPVFDSESRQVVGLHYTAVDPGILNAAKRIAALAEHSPLIARLVREGEAAASAPAAGVQAAPVAPSSPAGPTRAELDAFDDADYERAVAIRTIAALDAYAERHPLGRHLTAARDLRRELEAAERATRMEEAFATARGARTVAALEGFRTTWPESPRDAEAAALLDDLKAEAAAAEVERATVAALATGGIADLEAVLAAHPDAPRRAEIESALTEARDHAAALAAGTIEALEGYLAHYGEGARHRAAVAALVAARKSDGAWRDEEAWKAADGRDDIDGYREYLREFVGGIHASEAITRIADLTDWAGAEAANTTDAFGSYIALRPEGRRVGEAKARIDRLQLALLREGCEGYAREALEQVAAAESNGCDVRGARWLAIEEVHLNWCMTRSAEMRTAEAKARGEEIAACEARHADDREWSRVASDLGIDRSASLDGLLDWSDQAAVEAFVAKRVRQNARRGLETYVSHHPNGIRAEKARVLLSALDDMRWMETIASAERTESLSEALRHLRRYLEDFPQGRHKNEADGAIAETEGWSAARKTDRVASYETFLAKWPDRRFHKAALARADELREGERAREAELLAKLTAEPTAAHANAYLEAFPEGQNAAAAKALILELAAVEVARKENTLEAWQAFANAHPEGRFAEEAKAKVAGPADPAAYSLTVPEDWRVEFRDVRFTDEGKRLQLTTARGLVEIDLSAGTLTDRWRDLPEQVRYGTFAPDGSDRVLTTIGAVGGLRVVDIGKGETILRKEVIVAFPRWNGTHIVVTEGGDEEITEASDEQRAALEKRYCFDKRKRRRSNSSEDDCYYADGQYQYVDDQEFNQCTGYIGWEECWDKIRPQLSRLEKKKPAWGAARVYDAATGRQLFHLKGHTARMAAIAFSRDGTLLATGDQTGSIRIWSLKTGKLVRAIKAFEASDIAALLFDAEGKTLIAAVSSVVYPNSAEDLEAPLRQFTVATGKEVVAFRTNITIPPAIAAPNIATDEFDDRVGAVQLALSPNGQQFFALSGAAVAGQLSFFGHLRTLEGQAIVRLPHGGNPVLSMSPVFSPDGRYLAINEDRNRRLTVLFTREWDLDGKRVPIASFTLLADPADENRVGLLAVDRRPGSEGRYVITPGFEDALRLVHDGVTRPVTEAFASARNAGDRLALDNR